MLVLNMRAFENKKYTADDRFHGNGPYGEIPTKKEPIRTCGFALPCNKKRYSGPKKYFTYRREKAIKFEPRRFKAVFFVTLHKVRGRLLVRVNRGVPCHISCKEMVFLLCHFSLEFQITDHYIFWWSVRRVICQRLNTTRIWFELETLSKWQ